VAVVPWDIYRPTDVSQMHHVQEPIAPLKHQQGIALCLTVRGKRQKENQYKVCSMAGFAQSAVQYTARMFLLACIARRKWKSLVHTKQ